MILVKKNYKIGHLGHIWSIHYRTTSQFLQGGPIWPNKNNAKYRIIGNPPSYLYLSSPAPTVTAQTLINSMPATSLSPNGWAKIKPYDDCTAKPVALDSVNGKAHSCRIANCPRKMWYALSNVSATAALLKRRQTSVKWTLEPSSGCWKKQASVPTISTVCSLRISTSLSKWYRWMNCTVKQSKAEIKPNLLRSLKSCVNTSVKKGQNMASYGSGRKKQVPSRIDCRATNTANSFAIDRFCGHIFQGQRPSTDSYRRPSSVPTGNFADIRTGQASPPQKRQRQNKVSTTEATTEFAGGRCKEDSGHQRQFVEGIDQGVVWQKETNRKVYSKARHRPEDQYISHRKTQWHYKRPAGSSCSAYSQRFSSARDVAVFDMAVAGFVQLDKGSLLSAGRDACDGVVSCR